MSNQLPLSDILPPSCVDVSLATYQNKKKTSPTSKKVVLKSTAFMDSIKIFMKCLISTINSISYLKKKIHHYSYEHLLLSKYVG